MQGSSDFSLSQFNRVTGTRRRPEKLVNVFLQLLLLKEKLIDPLFIRNKVCRWHVSRNSKGRVRNNL